MIKINVDKAKAIGHDMRRAARAEEFKPFDEAIAKQIPGAADGAEAERQAIREKYAANTNHRSTQQQHPTRLKQH
jgi:hypothetical protein